MNIISLVVFLAGIFVSVRLTSAVKCKCSETVKDKITLKDCPDDCFYCENSGYEDRPGGLRSCTTKKSYESSKKRNEEKKKGLEYTDIGDDDLDDCATKPISNSVTCYCNNEDYCNHSTSVKPIGMMALAMMMVVGFVRVQ